MVWRIAPVLLLASTVAAAAAPLVPPSDQAGRERYRFTPSPLDRFMEPNPRRSRCCAGTATSANRGAARRAPGETGIAELMPGA